MKPKDLPTLNSHGASCFETSAEIEVMIRLLSRKKIRAVSVNLNQSISYSDINLDYHYPVSPFEVGRLLDD